MTGPISPRRRRPRAILFDAGNTLLQMNYPAIAEYLAATRGVGGTAEQVIIVSGIRQALAIAARLLLDPMWIMRQWNTEWKKSQWGNAADVSSRFASDLGE